MESHENGTGGKIRHCGRRRSRGMLASIGHRNAAAVVYGVKLSGFAAWFLWRGVYLAKLPTLSPQA